MAKLLCVGIGHVGLPLSLKFWNVGHDVSLVDVDISKIQALRDGIMPFHEAGCDELLAPASQDERFHPYTYDHPGFDRAVEGAEFIVLTLGTPLGQDYAFRFDQYFDVLRRVTPHLSRGVTLVVRSTVAPLFTRNVVSARIAAQRNWTAGVDFFPSFCPERLSQGNAVADIDDLPEIVGADDRETAARAMALFDSLAPDKQCIALTTVEAELAKLFLNTYRYTLFGLANEFALTAEQFGADMFAILEAANTSYPRGGIPRPGPSRGPCLGKDTSALAFTSTASLIAHAALKANENLVLHAANELRMALGGFGGRRISMLGMAFKAGTDDVRDTLTTPMVNVLDREGAHTAVYDPLVAQCADSSVLRGSDAVILMTAHDAFRVWDEAVLSELCGRPRGEIYVFDLWNIWPWANRILGKGSAEEHENSHYGSLRLAYARGNAPFA